MKLLAHASAARRGLLPSFFSAGGVQGDARGGTRASGVEPFLVDTHVLGAVVACGGLGEKSRVNFGGGVDESVVVFVWRAVVVGSFMGEPCFKCFKEWMT